MKKNFTYLGWALILGASLYFVVSNVPRYFGSESGFPKEALPFRPSHLIHIVMGTMMILFGPIQFITTIRKRAPKVHRYLGRIYVLCVVISGIAAIYIAINKMIISEGLLTFGTGLIGLAIASLVTTLTAYWMVRNKNYEQHREWMIRSYVVTLGFTTFRIFADVLNGALFHTNTLEMVNIMAWACWSVPLLVTEFFLQFNKTGKRLAGARAD